MPEQPSNPRFPSRDPLQAAAGVGAAVRGARSNPPNRFEALSLEPDPDWYEAEERPLATRFYRDSTQSALTYNDSPDIGFEVSLNPYRGCEHGCAYCYARPTHEYLGFSAGLDFESRILVKENAPELLRRELAARSWKPRLVAMSGVTDCYQPIERRLQLTRRCLAVFAECRNPVCIVTKNALVTRDADLLGELARHQAVTVLISLTTLDIGLRRVLEPRTSPPAARLQAIEALARANIPVGVLVAPVIPGLNDHELPRLLEAAAAHGALFAGYVVLRLPLTVEPIFAEWLGHHFPDRRDKVLNGLRDLRDGRLNDPNFSSRMTGTGSAAQRLRDLFQVSCRRAKIAEDFPDCSTQAFRRPRGAQLELW